MPPLPPTRGLALERAIVSATASTTSLPTFLVPAWQTLSSRPAGGMRPARCFSVGGRRSFWATRRVESKLGRTPISVPPEVTMTVGEPWVVKDLTTYLRKVRRTVTIEGPLGKATYDIPEFVKIAYDEKERKALLSVEDSEIKQQREMWGTTWAYLNRHIMGVSEGHTAVLRLVGIGYRASVEARPKLEEYPGQPFVCLKLGYTHPIEMGVPKGVAASTPAPTRILLEGVNRETVMSFAGKIREWRKPEPYKGKGVFINDETIKLKQKKIK